MKTEELKVEGMTCGHCVMSVKKGLAALAGVKVIDVQIGRAEVEYDEGTVTRADLTHAINAAGYKVVG